MQRSSQRLAIGALGVLMIVGATRGTKAEGRSQAQPSARLEDRIVVSVETFCSETKLRTTNARIRWSMPAGALEANHLTTLTAARQILEATVYKNGFDKGLVVALPIGQATPERPVLPQVQGRQPQRRAFQIRLIEVRQPGAQLAAGAAAEVIAVVENLEPGVNYTWRVRIDDRVVSPSITVQARVCPADMVGNPAVRRRQR